MRSLKENAWKKFSNLLPTQGKSRLVIASAKDQRAKLKEQQAARNRLQQDRLSDLRQKNRALSSLRADLRHKARLNRK